jgi:hypothetical protein
LGWSSISDLRLKMYLGCLEQVEEAMVLEMSLKFGVFFIKKTYIEIYLTKERT